jgi:hypothetical protein
MRTFNFLSPKIEKYDLDETLDPVKNKIEDGSMKIGRYLKYHL